MDNYDYVLEKMFSNLKYDDKLSSGFKSIVAQVYERVAVELLIAWQDKIFTFERVGRYWDSD